MILLDSNVVIDLFSSGSEWQEWSQNAVEEAVLDHELAVSQVVVAEVAPYLGSLEIFIERIGRFGATVAALTNEAAYAAGTAFVLYRKRRKDNQDTAKSIIADFLIGGHATALGATILTRDPRFYCRYFPDVPLITPTSPAT